MINFRFHLVSLVAVFLALAAGIVIGSTVVDKAIVDALHDQINATRSRADATRDRNRELSRQVRELRDTAELTAPFAVDRLLTGVNVLVIAMRGTDRHVVGDLVDRLTQANAVVPAVVWIERAWTFADPDDQDRLAAILDRPEANAAALRRAAIAAVARGASRTDAGGDSASPTAGTAPPATVFDMLVGARFVSVDLRGGRPVAIGGGWPGPGGRVLVIGGAGEADGLERVAPVVADAFARAGLPTLVADAYDDGEDVDRAARLQPIRGTEISKRVGTVDDVETAGGTVAAVLALRDMPRVVGHYGVGKGANGLAPTWASP
jgi:hypothetical protein